MKGDYKNRNKMLTSDYVVFIIACGLLLEAVLFFIIWFIL